MAMAKSKATSAVTRIMYVRIQYAYFISCFFLSPPVPVGCPFSLLSILSPASSPVSFLFCLHFLVFLSQASLTVVGSERLLTSAGSCETRMLLSIAAPLRCLGLSLGISHSSATACRLTVFSLSAAIRAIGVGCLLLFSQRLSIAVKHFPASLPCLV